MLQQLSCLSSRKGWMTTWYNLPKSCFLFYKLFMWKNIEVNEFFNCLIIMKLWQKENFKLLAELNWKLKLSCMEYLMYFSLHNTNLFKFNYFNHYKLKYKLKLVILSKYKIKTYLVKKKNLASLIQFKSESKFNEYLKWLNNKFYMKKRLNLITYNVSFWFNSKLLCLIMQLYLFKKMSLKLIMSNISMRLLSWKNMKPIMKIFLTSFGFFKYKLSGFFFSFSGKFGFNSSNRLAKTKLMSYGSMVKSNLDSMNDIYQLPIITKYGVFGTTICLSYQLLLRYE